MANKINDCQNCLKPVRLCSCEECVVCGLNFFKHEIKNCDECSMPVCEEDSIPAKNAAGHDVVHCSNCNGGKL